MRLFEYEEAIRGCILFDEETGEIIDIDEEKLSQLELDRQTKRESIAMIIKEERSLAEMIKAEEQTLTKRRKTKENHADWLEEYLKKDLDGEGFETPKVKVSFKPSFRTIITEESLIPFDFKKVEYKIDKKAIGDVLKAGGTVLGAERVKFNNMTIK